MAPERLAEQVLTRLEEQYESKTALTYRNPFQLLVATILSAQCTDKRVNRVTRDLFERYASPEDFAEASHEDVGQMIRSTGYFNQKATYIRESCRAIVEQHDGKVPQTMEELTELHGVGRKTANVVLSEAFGKNEGIAVDTHVGRVSRRIGLTEKKSATAVEKDLMEAVPKENWWDFNKLLVEHGRAVCDSRKPACNTCVLNDLCSHARRGEGTAP